MKTKIMTSISTFLLLASAAVAGPAKVQIKHGFYLDSFESAVKECRAKKHPILMLFSARWCPGCMRMEREIWDNASMKPILSKFAKVKLDADRFANAEMMKKYDVAGIPASLVLNCDGEELERFVDYQEPEVLRRGLEHIASAKDLPTHSELAKRADGGDTVAALTLGRRAALAYANEEALKWYAKVPTRENELEYWWAKVGQDSTAAAKEPSDATKKRVRETLEAAIAKFPETPSTLDWRSQLADLRGTETKEGKKVLEDLVALCDGLIKDPARMEKFNKAEFAGDYRGIESLKVYEAKAEALESLKKDDEAKQAWKDGVAEGGRLGIKDEPSGKFFRFLGILKKAGEKERVTKFFESNLKKNPKDPELLRRYAKFLQEQGDFKRSAELAKKSLEGSYDRNAVFAAHVYATSLAKSGSVPEAKKFLQDYLARPELTASSREELQSALSALK